MQRPLPNSYWVVPGKLLAGEYPLGRKGGDERLRLEQLVAAGVSLFVDLTEPDECSPYESLLPDGASYVRLPVADQSVPDDEIMQRIQAEIAAAIGTGQCVYVHCRAGIGRTGTAVGCFLSEQGLEPGSALTRLNELWQQSARAASWPTVPQTEEQAEYIRRWRRRPEAIGSVIPVDLRAVASLRQRFEGALLGLALGDALAAATQYRRAGHFTPVGDLLGGGPFELPRGAWSDDTAMALCLAESLVETGGGDPDDQLARYARWQREGYPSATGQCVGITAATVRALKGRAAAATGEGALRSLDPEPLSRVAPVVMYAFAEPQLIIEQVLQATRVTCHAPPVLDACRRLAAMVHAALQGYNRQAVLGVAEPPVAAPAVSPTAGAPALLELAAWAFGSTDNFRDGALRAVNLGGDADVIGAAYGQLAGAHYGVRGLPRAWLAALAQREQIAALADRLLNCAVIRLSEGVHRP
ncbi:MAG TPA: ADP-ribosylglycohydrolase family protein [Steroidobacteraceae bacterium]